MSKQESGMPKASVEEKKMKEEVVATTEDEAERAVRSRAKPKTLATPMSTFKKMALSGGPSGLSGPALQQNRTPRMPRPFFSNVHISGSAEYGTRRIRILPHMRGDISSQGLAAIILSTRMHFQWDGGAASTSSGSGSRSNSTGGGSGGSGGSGGGKDVLRELSARDARIPERVEALFRAFAKLDDADAGILLSDLGADGASWIVSSDHVAKQRARAALVENARHRHKIVKERWQRAASAVAAGESTGLDLEPSGAKQE